MLRSQDPIYLAESKVEEIENRRMKKKLGLSWAKLSSSWDWTLIKSNLYLVSLYLI